MVYGVILCHADIRLKEKRTTPLGRRWAGALLHGACTHACAETAQPHKSLRKAPGRAHDLEVPGATGGVAPVVWVMALGRRASSASSRAG